MFGQVCRIYLPCNHRRHAVRCCGRTQNRHEFLALSGSPTLARSRGSKRSSITETSQSVTPRLALSALLPLVNPQQPAAASPHLRNISRKFGSSKMRRSRVSGTAVDPDSSEAPLVLHRCLPVAMRWLHPHPFRQRPAEKGIRARYSPPPIALLSLARDVRNDHTSQFKPLLRIHHHARRVVPALP